MRFALPISPSQDPMENTGPGMETLAKLVVRSDTRNAGHEREEYPTQLYMVQ